jgi:hypothetical protein
MPQALSGRWLFIARLGWLVVALLALRIFLTGIPARYDQLLEIASGNALSFEQLGLSEQLYAAYFTALDLILVLTHLGLAALIMWHRSDKPMAAFVSLILVTAPLAVIDALQASTATFSIMADGILFLGLTASVTLLYLFPNGRFVPSWSWIFVAIWAALNGPGVFAPESPLSLASWSKPAQLAVLVFLAGSGILSQVYRYGRVSNPNERQQAKWAVLGLMAAAVGPFSHYLQIFTLPSLGQATPPSLFYNLADPAVFTFGTLLQGAGLTIYTLVGLLFPVSLAVAILRYHLFDIGLLINRTLIYSTLTVALALIYAASVLLIQFLFGELTGQVSRWTVAISTLTIAGLFIPLRRRIQDIINLRFYRRKYDAAQALAGFSVVARDEVDLDRLASELLRVLNETMQPAHASLWLCSTWLEDEEEIGVRRIKEVSVK